MAQDTRAGAPACTVVLTRPAGQSDALAAELAAAGLATFDFPLIGIAPTADPAPLQAALGALGRYALVVFVSPNAVDHALAQYDAIWPPALPVAVVGPGSVAALARHGVAAPAYRVVSPAAAPGDETARFDSEALFAALDAQLGVASLAGARVLIVRGDGGREWLAERLREAGAEVDVVAAYRRFVPEPSIAAWQRVHALLAGAPHVWLVTSSEGMRNLDALARDHLNPAEIAQLKRAALVAPHPRIAQTARGLGFDSITVSGAGDERMLHALLSAVPSVVQPVSALPAHSRMTESNASTNASPQQAAPVAPPRPTVAPPREPSARRGASTPLLWFVVVVIACAAGAGGYALNRKIVRLDAQLTQRQQANDAQTAELRVKTDEAVATVRQMDAQLSQLDGKLADAQQAEQALQQQYADLARNRDDWTFAEVGQMLSSASEQLQLTGNTQLALFALQHADTRLAALNSPQALMARKAIAQDIDKLKAAPSTDLTGLAIKLDNAIDMVDTLPLAGEVQHTPAAAPAAVPLDSASAAAGEPRWKAWWRQFTAGLGQQLRSLVEVRRIDHPDAMLVSPDEGYFLRENLKLRLLSARLSLLSRNEATLKSDLQAADAALVRYFDASSPRTQTVRALVKEVDQGSGAVALPNLSTSLQAINQYRSGS